MPSVFNPSDYAKVHHIVNGNLYEILPGGKAEVREQDVHELVRLLQFLVINKPGEDEKGEIFVQNKDGSETTTDISIEDAKKKFSGKPHFACDLSVIKENPATGIKESVPCGFFSATRRALVAHKKADHDGGEYKTTRVTEREMNKDKDDEPRRGPGRPRKADLE